MDKLKKFYNNNRIYCILMIVTVTCLVIILLTMVIYFVKQSTTSVYGNRLEGIENYPVDSEVSDANSFLSSTDGVLSESVRIQGKIIYVDLTMSPDKSNDDIQSICSEMLTKFTDEQKSYYDFQFIVSREGMNPYLGSKSASRTVISWGNYSYETTTSEAS